VVKAKGNWLVSTSRKVRKGKGKVCGEENSNVVVKVNKEDVFIDVKIGKERGYVVVRETLQMW